MEKNTLLAIVLSMAVLFGFFIIQGILFPPAQPDPAAVSGAAESPAASPVSPVAAGQEPAAVSQGPVPAVEQPPEIPAAAPSEGGADQPRALPPVVIETNLIRVTLSNVGGNMISYKLKEHKEHPDSPELVEMIVGGIAEPQAFTVSFGPINDILAQRLKPANDYFHIRRLSEFSVEFYRDYSVPGGGVFRLTKRYDFMPNEYLFEMTVSMDGGYAVGSFNFDGAAYTLGFGPQIGPSFVKLDQRTEFRQYITYTKNKVRQEKPDVVNRDMPPWAGIVGKYFAVLAIPTMNQFELAFSTMREDGLSDASRLFVTRPAYGGSRLEDKYYFYMGPKKQEVLETYYNGKNNFTPPIHGYQLVDAAKTRTFMSIPPLENFLKWVLMMIVRIIPNYGVAIIVLTVLVKLALFPLTKKGSESTMRMQTLAPRIKEIQEKYADNKQKMNQEMAEFYKKEGYNPLSGCLPMLIQLPIFFAMYNLFNNHFDLRGAMFIPGWIPDLSLPESIWDFPDGFRLPLLGWTSLRLLPFIYVGSQLLYGKVTQTPDQQGNSQMKIMLYAMPLVFFFILYDVPSGLLVYWIMSNLLTMVQQLTINKYIKAKKAAIAAGVVEQKKPVIAPRKKKK